MKDLTNICLRASLNGDLSVGIAAGIDKALDDDQKLRVKRGENNIDKAIAFSLSYLKRTGDTIADEILESGVCAVHLAGLVSPSNNDIVLLDNPLPGPYPDTTKEEIDGIRRSLTIGCGTKLNFYSTNHHTGTGNMGAYPLKLYNSLYDTIENPTSIVIAAVHTIGHWMDTRAVLTRLGFEGLGKTNCVSGAFELSFEDDFKVRRTAMPAGTASLSLCHTILVRMKTSNLRYAIPDPSMIKRIHEQFEEVYANRPAYHMSAKSLTGKDRLPYSDAEFTGYLGILGAFAYTFFPSSTICKSPKISSGKALKYKECENYSEEFESLCIRVKKEQLKGIEGDITPFLPTVATSIEETRNLIDSYMKNVKVPEH